MLNSNKVVSSAAARKYYGNIIRDYFNLYLRKNLVIVSDTSSIKVDNNIYAVGGYAVGSEGYLINSITDFISHIWSSNGGHRKDDSFTPIPKGFIMSYFSKLNKTDFYSNGVLINELTGGLSALVELGLLEKTAYEQGSHCYGYKLSDKISIVLAIAAVQYENRKAPESQDVTNNHITLNNINSYDSESTGVYPNLSLYSKVLNKLGRVDVDLISFKDSYKKLLGISEYKSPIEVLIELNSDKSLNVIQTARRYLADVSKVTSVHDAKGTSRNFNYVPRFSLNATGRITEINGIQGITRLSKSILITNSKTQVNYDIKASQMHALEIMLGRLVSTVELTDEDSKTYADTINYLHSYNSDKSTPDLISASLGITKDDWKKIIYSVVFGSNYANAYSSSSDIIRRYPQFNYEYWKYLQNTLFKPVDIWMKYVDKYTKLNTVDNLVDNGLVTLDLASDAIKARLIDKGSKFLSAFWLQGLETSYIFDIIINMDNKLISYEYDGLITEGDLSTTVVSNSAISSGFTNAVLESKEVYSSGARVASTPFKGSAPRFKQNEENMPTYNYTCECKTVSEIRKMSDRNLVKICPDCKTGQFREEVSGSAPLLYSLSSPGTAAAGLTPPKEFRGG